MRLVFGVEYEGTDWNGWQTQLSKNTVQDKIEAALSKFADQKIKTICAGRTDSGVHAKGQVIHFDSQVDRQILSWVRGTNSLLPKSIRLKWGATVKNDFHARFSAKSRVYSYSICNTPIESPLSSRLSTWIYQKLNEKKMQKASLCLIGKHDFSAFRSSECQAKSPIRVIKRCDLMRKGDFLKIEIEADAFLHHMVRNIMGCLYEIGRDVKTESWLKVVMDSKNRKNAARTLPPQGLCLEYVNYGRDFLCELE
ncbi:MAG: tRNA pseudouridine(38-40) synthase TruA [Betaproteobacteria bacterium TMED41]|nr:MAG: tRNA pseudouridine(38-40) synthase TruA [Betaproteobacteria bacterium TMED41]